MTTRCGLMAACVLAMGTASAGAADMVQNGDFEATNTVRGAANADIGFGRWQLGADQQAPASWTLNPAYPGTLTVLRQGAYSGTNCLRIEGSNEERAAHVYQPCPAIAAGKWYKVSARVRGGRASIGFYEYYREGPIKAPTVCSGTSGPDTWRQISGYYAPMGGGLQERLAGDHGFPRTCRGGGRRASGRVRPGGI